MWKIVEIIARILLSDEGAEVVISKFAKYSKAGLGKWANNILVKSKLGRNVLKMHQMFKSTKEKIDFVISLTDPNKIVSLIKAMPQKELNDMLKMANKTGKEKLQEAMKKRDQEKLKEHQYAKEINAKDVEEYKKNYKTTLKNYQPEFLNEWYISSSSWVKQIMFTNYSNTTGMGRLHILVKSDKGGGWYGPYVYPSIRYTTFLNMLAAKGKNGSGAGSVMWREFLRTWLPSQLRAYIASNMRKNNMRISQNIEYWKEKNKEINSMMDSHLRRLENKYYKTPQSLIGKGIDNRFFKQKIAEKRLNYLSKKQELFRNALQITKQNNMLSHKERMRNIREIVISTKISNKLNKEAILSSRTARLANAITSYHKTKTMVVKPTRVTPLSATMKVIKVAKNSKKKGK